MVRFETLEQLGVRVAVMSDIGDGDCRLSSSDGMAARRRFCEASGVPYEHVAIGCQVHGAQIAIVNENDRGRGHEGFHAAFEATDGLITDVPGLPIGLSIADCVPVFLFDSKRRAIGLVHAGREGTMQRIAALAVEAMQRVYDCEPSDIHAVIGPSAGPKSYEVSEEMAQAFTAAGFPARGRYIDLWEANAMQLVSAGLRRDTITIAGVCTIASGRFHSHRAHGNGARNLALIML
ncbi:MAG TPA: polyphenol oxidase family protein [Candidatus Hydrogenedentes bacterium]|nr:polyphenol oxidase family protein [Candidatus Hydrogenedentota bacterium]